MLYVTEAAESFASQAPYFVLRYLIDILAFVLILVSSSEFPILTIGQALFVSILPS